ncbi:hypothetical protein C8Q80DRAFT_1314256 [Daedaleopsis nitida]|nr:hypothetical protein C8Q80DRAFT_1314256 [Daedaleopsis nitida]
MSESVAQAATEPSASTSTQETAPSATEKPAFKYYRSPASQQPHSELPDNYFDATAADVRAQQAMLTARRDALQNTPLRTTAMREAEDKKRRARWPQTTIRVRFADMTLLEKTFPSTDKIRSVYAFVRSSLREDVKPVKFVLYQSPPKREYKVSDPKVRDLTLAELDLAPSSVLMIKFDDDKFNHVGVPAPLDTPILAAIEDFPIPPDFDNEPADSKAAKNSGAGGSKPRGSLFGKNEEGERKLPKWMKLGPSEPATYCFTAHCPLTSPLQSDDDREIYRRITRVLCIIIVLFSNSGELLDSGLTASPSLTLRRE